MCMCHRGVKPLQSIGPITPKDLVTVARLALNQTAFGAQTSLHLFNVLPRIVRAFGTYVVIVRTAPQRAVERERIALTRGQRRDDGNRRLNGELAADVE
jgi:hypothetical protein